VTAFEEGGLMRDRFSALTACVAAGVLAAAQLDRGRWSAIAWSGSPAGCAMAGYTPIPGINATAERSGVSIVWDGDKDQEARLRLTLNGGVPTIQELAVRPRGSRDRAWTTLLTGATPDFRVVSGLRRITNQQLDPLAGIGVNITKDVIDRWKWEAFWDAPLNIPGGESAHNNTTPPQRGVLNQPRLPRTPEEIRRATALFEAGTCDVKSNGARLEVSFPGVQLGIFDGRLQYTIYRGTNLIRQEIIARTDEPSVAYKYDGGITGVRIATDSRVTWRSVTNLWQEYRFGGAPNPDPVTVKTSNRILVAEVHGGSIAVFPPPHTFFWARETSYNLGYNWYRKDSASSYSFGVRQAENEESVENEARGTEDRRQNFALRSARPGTWQRMPVYLYFGAAPGPAALESALAFTRGDRFQHLPGYQVMATHFHMGLVGRARGAGSLDARVPDLDVLRAAGVTIVAPIDGGGGVVPVAAEDGGPGIPGVDDPKWFQWSRGLGAAPGNDETGRAGGRSAGAGRGGLIAGRGGAGGRGSFDPLKGQADYYETARLQSDRNFAVMPNVEIMRGEVARSLGGHSDILISHPVYWTQGRLDGQPLVEERAPYGKVYHVGTTDDMMEMVRREDMLIYMPHPRSKGSTGFPDAIKDTPHFNDPNYRGFGFRWGMGLDGSEQRLCEYRCLPLFDDMNNWVADKPTPAKFIQAISEIYQQSYGDDIYSNNPVNYVRVDPVPPPGDWSPIIRAMRTGDYFVTSGEVLVPSYAVDGAGGQRTIVADVEWTFPLEFVEIVWGDGQHTDRQIISATDLPPFGQHRFRIPFSAAGKKWVRFAIWDSAGNGALLQPVKLTGATTTASR
jgi:hypothetical protein